MSPLAKVFVVLNLILALVFLGVSATLFTARKDYEAAFSEAKDAHETAAKLAGSKINRLDGQLSQSQNNNDSLTREKQALETAKQSLESEKNDLVTSNRDQKAEIARLNDAVELRQGQIDNKDQEIARLSEANDKAMAAAAAARDAKTVAIANMTRSILDQEETVKRLSEAEIQVASLSKKNEEYAIMVQAAEDKGINLATLIIKPAPAIDTVIEAVRPDANLVILGVGADDKVEVGHEFTISRGENFVAKVRVIRTTPDMAGARIVFTADKQNIEVGDSATTRGL